MGSPSIKLRHVTASNMQAHATQTSCHFSIRRLQDIPMQDYASDFSRSTVDIFRERKGTRWRTLIEQHDMLFVSTLKFMLKRHLSQSLIAFKQACSVYAARTRPMKNGPSLSPALHLLHPAPNYSISLYPTDH